MIAKNFVDEIVPDWQLQPEEAHRIIVRSTIVYRLPGTQKQFSKSVAALEARQDAFAKELIDQAEQKGIFRIIDQEVTEAARIALTRKHGTSFLDTFIYDTERSIVAELGIALRRISEQGVRAQPERAGDAISLSPARSFSSASDLTRYEQKRGSVWSPTVRLELMLTLEGPREQVEQSVQEIKAAMLFCGPLTSFTETAGVPMESDEPALRLQLAAV